MSERYATIRHKSELRQAREELKQLTEWLDVHGVPKYLATGEELNALGRVKMLLLDWKRKYEPHQTSTPANTAEIEGSEGTAPCADARETGLGDSAVSAGSETP